METLILGDPRTTTHISASEAVLLTKDLYTSKWVRKWPQKCRDKQKKTLLVTVISAPGHFEEREAIRQGWGKTAEKMQKVALIFVVGVQVIRIRPQSPNRRKVGDQMLVFRRLGITIVMNSFT